jgi:hypothetical protein
MRAQTDIHTPIIRCGTPDCDWGFRLPDMSAWRIERCYAKCREHCIERHALRKNDTDAQMFFDLKEGRLIFFKDK